LAGLAAAAQPDQVSPDVDREEAAEDMLGLVIDGRYRVDELIGEGGMGRVYLAEHVDIGKRVAVKVLHAVYGRMPDLVERFRREARAASKIGHPHIVDVTDSGTTETGAVYFVMEYLEGVELADVIDREGALDITRTLHVATQITRALSAAHAVGIIHRDLKPENIFLTMRSGTSDFVKVLDFGIAKSTEAEQARDKRLTSPGMAMGTPEYMSPEQAAGRPADQRCDIYSLGAILYEALTGLPPYEGENFMEILTKKATLDPPPAHTVRRELPEAISDLVASVMARDPADRPQTMEAVEYELTKCLAGRGAAVAQILGMSADPVLVAALNPGIAVQLEEQGLALRSDRSLTPARGLTPPGTSTGVKMRAAKTPSGVEVSEAYPVTEEVAFGDSTASVAMPRSRVGLLGWVVLLALVGTAIGVIFFVASGERSRKGVPVAATAGGDVGPGGRRDPAVGAGLVADAATTNAASGQWDAGASLDDPDEQDASAGDPTGKPTGKKPKDRPRIKPRPPSVDGIPRTKKEAKALLREADGHKGKMNWDAARGLYSRVARGKHLRSRGLLGLARVAFETKNMEAAIKHAKAALKAGAGDAARMVLGHAYFKKGHFADALRLYEEVLKHKPGDNEAQRSADLARGRLGK